MSNNIIYSYLCNIHILGFPAKIVIIIAVIMSHNFRYHTHKQFIFFVLQQKHKTPTTVVMIIIVCSGGGNNAITRVRTHAQDRARVITCCQTMAYHNNAVAIINNVGGPRAAAVSARAHARYETSGRPRYGGGRVWRGGRLLSSARTRAVFRGWPLPQHTPHTHDTRYRKTPHGRTDR